MSKKASGPKGTDKALANLAAIAKRLPNVEEGIACAGTAVESRTIKVNGKAFLFLRRGQVMLKLAGSLDEAKKLAKRSPEAFFPGSGGWTKVVFEDGPPPMALMERWIQESHGLFANPVSVAHAKRGKKSATLQTGGARTSTPPTRPTRRRA